MSATHLPSSPLPVSPPGFCSAAKELLDALAMAETTGISENKLLVEVSGSHNIHCSEKLFIPYISKSKLVSWVFTVTSSSLSGPWCQLRHVFMLDPFLPEFSITNISATDKPVLTVLPNSQEWTNNFKEPVPEFKVTIQFVSSSYGNFYQRLVFDFGSNPKIVRNLGVMVAPEQSLVKQLTYRVACEEENELAWLSNFTLVTCDGKVDDGKKKSVYSLPPNMKNALEYGSFDHMDATLTPSNYCDRLHTLLYIEEYERRKQMTKLNLHTDDILKCTQPSAEYVNQINVVLPINPDIFEDASHLINRSSFALVKVIPPGKKRTPKLYEVTVEALKIDSVVFLISEALERVIKQAKSPLPADVCFRFVDTFKFMHKAIDNIDLHCVFPSNRSGLSLEWEVATHAFLNKPQATALSHILDPRPKPPLLIFGPFGTGKTRTIAESVKELCRLHSGNPEETLRILICTHSNSAADHYIVDYLHPFVTSKKSGSFLCKPLRICWENRFINSVNSTVLKYCLIDKETGKFAVPDKKCLDRYRVIVTTLVTADVLVGLALPSGYFSHVFVDEAAQAMEAESIIPLCLAHPSTRVVLAGDHLQLGAIVSSRVARQLALDRSLLVRLYDFYPETSNCRLLLLENYRAYKDIVDIPSKLFYEGTLVAHKTRPPSSDYPIRFYGVLGKEARASDIGSYFNMAEAAEICERVEQLVDRWTAESDENIMLENICVLAPYTAQVREIRQLLRKKKLGQVRVDGVNNVQGLEFDALFISTVHTSYSMSVEALERDELGFLSDPRLLNTAVTRAKYHLAFVGDPSALCGAGECKACWKTILSKCNENGTFHYRLSFEKVIEYTKFNNDDPQPILDGPSSNADFEAVTRLILGSQALSRSMSSTTTDEIPASSPNASTAGIWNGGINGHVFANPFVSRFQPMPHRPAGPVPTPGVGVPPMFSAPPRPTGNVMYTPGQIPVYPGNAGFMRGVVGMPPLYPSPMLNPPGFRFPALGQPVSLVAVPKSGQGQGQGQGQGHGLPTTQMFSPSQIPLAGQLTALFGDRSPGQGQGQGQPSSHVFNPSAQQMPFPYATALNGPRLPGPGIQPNYLNPNATPFQFPGQAPVQRNSPALSQCSSSSSELFPELSRAQSSPTPPPYTPPIPQALSPPPIQSSMSPILPPAPSPANQTPSEYPAIRSYAQVASEASAKDEQHLDTPSKSPVSQVVQSLTYNVTCRQQILLEEEKCLLEISADAAIMKSVAENIQKQLGLLEEERESVLRRLSLNEALARQIGVDCTAASSAGRMWNRPFKFEDEVEENDGKVGNPEESSETEDARYEEFHDSDTEEWFQSRRDDPLVKEYIKAFESHLEAFLLDSDDQYFQANDEEESPSDVVPFSTRDQPADCTVKLSNEVSYIGNVIHHEYLDERTAHSRLVSNELLLCTLEISNSSGGYFAYAKVLDPDIKAILLGVPKERIGSRHKEDESAEIVISNRPDMNRALNGDVVAVEIIHRNSQQIRGKVVFLYREVHLREYVCSVDIQDSNVMIPIDKTNPNVFVLQSKDHRGEIGVAVFSIKDGETHCQEFVTETSGKLFLVRLLEWGENYRFPLGIVRKCFREPFDLNSAVPVFAAEYGIRLSQPQDVLGEVRDVYPNSWKIPLVELQCRSHRYCNAFTLDCSSSLGIELDDAISIKRESSGIIEVGVHVSDLSYFVPKGSFIDKAAYLQGSSVYPDQECGPSINMLPRRLSQDLCSLVPGEERLAVSVIFKLDSEGKILRQPEIHRSVVVSCCNLSFEECDAILAGDSREKPPGNIERDVVLLSKLTRNIAAKQARQGCKAGIGDPVRKNGSKSSQIVEQLMIMTNRAVAQRMLSSPRTRQLAPLRRQLPPKSHLLESFNQWCRDNGVLQSGSLSLRRLQDNARPQDDVIKDKKIELSCLGHISTAINANNLTQLTEALLKCDEDPFISEAHSRLCLIQERSQYIVSSSPNVDLKHFTLGLECYTHFSSPLRRYFDLVVHRCLLALIYDKELPYSEAELQKICFDCQVTSSRANAFEKNCSSTALASALRSSPKWRTAKIERVSPDRITSICKISDSTKPMNICTKVQQLRPVKTEFVEAEKELHLTWESRETLAHGSQRNPNSPPQSKNDTFYARIPSTSWVSLVSEVARSNLKKIIKEWKKINSNSLVVDHAPSITSSVRDAEIFHGSNEMSATSQFRVNSSLQVLFGSEKRRGVLQPDVQGIHLTGTGFSCTRHQKSPDSCFCAPLTFPTLPYYVDEQHYQGVMVPLLEAEAAVAVMGSPGKRFVVQDVRLSWIAGPGTVVCATMTVPEDEQQGFQLSTGDYACVRSLHFSSTINNEEDPSSSEHNILLHARVASVAENSDSRFYTLQLVEPSHSLSAEILNNDTRLYEVECIPQDQRFRVMIQAVKEMYKASDELRSVVLHQDLPSAPHKTNMSTLKGFPLDIDQAEAVKAALSLPLTVIHGQPGTGKTWTAVAIICHYIKRNWQAQGGQVLVCAPTNKALDVLAKMLVKVPSVKILRVYSREVESKALDKSQDSDEPMVIPECERVALHMRVCSPDNPNANALLLCARELEQLKQKIEESKKRGKDCSELLKKFMSRKLKYNAILDAAERYEFTETSTHVILCTCVESGSPRVRKFTRVTQCIVDESNMCLDAELLVPLVTAGQQCDHVVIIGDQKELVPVVRSKLARKLGLGRSLFGSLCEQKEGKKYACCLLRMQFRMHPSIRIFSSEYFYTGKPVFDAPETTDSIIRLDGFWPNRNQVYHLFCHVTGKEHTATCFSLGEDREDCRFNPAEVDMIVSLVERLASHNIKMKYITIISPFSTQRAKIRDALKHQPNVEEVQITSPQDSQGSENAFVIISTVRSRSRDQSAFSEHSGKIGCLGDAHQMNVALTRARLGLIILGDQEFLRSIPIWNKLISEYKSSDCVVDRRSWP